MDCFADPKDPRLRTLENSFMLGPLLIYSSTANDLDRDQVQHVLPKGIWLDFDFEDSHPDLPALYLQGGSIIPFGPAIQHVGQAKPTDDLSLLVALDEHGKAEVSRTEGSWKRPERRLHVQLLLGGYAKLDAWGVDGEEIQITVPSENDVSELVSMSAKQYKIRIETAKHIPEVEKVSRVKGIELSKTPIELKSGVWALKVVPWIGGRIISMEHLPSGIQWFQSMVEVNGYEEYSGTEYRSAGCSEEYTVIERDLQQAGEQESLLLEGDVGGGLALVLLDSQGIRVYGVNLLWHCLACIFWLVCLRVHPVFTLVHPADSYVYFTSIDGSKHEVWPESGEETTYEGDLRPNGEWMLADRCLGLGLTNRFKISEVYKCLIHWGSGTVNLELWSEDRPVSKESPLGISHEYEVKRIA
ncbi:unnamed protein product [Thlaspi arvense]|uniref:Uncharacterized protein n=1 Tax=Thlaspi arvense TaxID=13288 RepID=A0AAU9S2S4_THLAR|nr:unnamed protein product [Thlaspi arvense]